MKPRIFIGSSIEGKYIADALQANLEYSAWCTIWEHAFLPSQITIDSLIRKSTDSDFAIFVFSDDDIIKIRNKEHSVARDNVVFESGLFMGELGRDRVFIVRPRDVGDFHMLSDLLGVTPVTYESERAKRKGQANAALATAANNIEEAIRNSNWTNLKLKITAKSLSSSKPELTYPLKLEFCLKYPHPYPVTIQSISFRLCSELRFAPNSGDEQHKPLFLRVEKDGSHKYKEQITIEKLEQVFSCWLPIDPTIQNDVLTKLVAEKTTGIWSYKCAWLKDQVIVCNYEEQF